MNIPNNKVGIVCCSNGQKVSYAQKINYLKSVLSDMRLEPVLSNFIYAKEGVFSGNAEERASALMDFYKDEDIKEIFDISGGDIANGILPYLDYQLIKNSSKRFWGYSDLTTVINAIYTKTGKPSVLYQIRNLIDDFKNQQISDFKNSVIRNRNDLFNISYNFLQQKSMKGIVIGGNIRCFLKLAGTEYMPDFTDKILLLESYNGNISQIETYLCQLSQLSAFDKISGILLGTFTQIEAESCFSNVEMLIKKFSKKTLPIAVTKDIGHGADSKAIVIGREMLFE